MHPRPVLALMAFLALVALPAVPVRGEDRDRTDPPPIVVLGFAGADATLVKYWLEQGVLPNLARLRQEGGWAPLLPGEPPEALAAWTALSTGLTSGRGGMIRRLRRDPISYEARAGFFEEERVPLLWGERDPLVLGLVLATVVGALLSWLLWSMRLRWRWAVQIGVVVALVLAAPAWVAFDRLLPRERQRLVPVPRGETVWARFAAAGRPTTVVHVPGTFPAQRVPGGRLLAGPPFMGSIRDAGGPVLYTTRGADTIGGQAVAVRTVELGSDGATETAIQGPVDPASPDRRLTVPLRLVPDAAGRSVAIELADRVWSLREGEWSHWIRVQFPVNALLDRVAPVERLARFRVLSVAPDVSVYLAPLVASPGRQGDATGSPREWARLLTARLEIAPFEGSDADLLATPSLPGDTAFVVREIMAAQERRASVMMALLDSSLDALHFQVFDGPERAGHLLWPDTLPGDTSDRLDDDLELLRRVYVQMDRIVGRAMRRLPPDALLVVCSAHGMAPVSRLFDTAAWLAHEGYLIHQTPGGGEAGTTQHRMNVDWADTVAYADGPAGITLNVQGRQARGAVAAADRTTRLDEIRHRLLSWVDPATGGRPLAQVLMGPGTGGPDLLLVMSVGYGVDPSPLARRPAAARRVTRAAPAPWSGAHLAQSPGRVAGILFVNRPLAAGLPRVRDLAPTLLAAGDVPVPAALEGRLLLAGQRAAR